MIRIIFLLCTVAMIVGCATATPVVGSAAPERGALITPGGSMAVVEPVRVVQLAAQAAPKGVLVKSQFEVQATGTERDLFFLNSERDYRDQRNLTVVISESTVKALREQHGADLSKAFLGIRIVVTGVARRVKISFYAGGRQTDKYYYQTHVRVSDPRQLQVVGPGG